MVFKQRLRLARGHSNLLRLAGGTAFKQLFRSAGGWWYLNNGYVWQGVTAFKQLLHLAGGSWYLNNGYVWQGVTAIYYV